MELRSAMSTLRAVRRLKPDPIADDVIDRILSAATWAPTGGNMQPWRIIAVTDNKIKQQLEDLYRPHWEGYVPGYEKKMRDMPADTQETSRRALESGTYLATHMHEAPLIAVFCYNPSIMTITDADQDRTSVVGGGSVYPAVQNLLLAARNEGLGCVLTTLLCLEEARVKALLHLPENWFTCAHVPIGYPVRGGHGPISRRSLAQMVARNSWDNFGE